MRLHFIYSDDSHLIINYVESYEDVGRDIKVVTKFGTRYIEKPGTRYCDGKAYRPKLVEFYAVGEKEG